MKKICLREILNKSLFEYVSISHDSNIDDFLAKFFQMFWIFWIFVYVTAAFFSLAFVFALVVKQEILNAISGKASTEGEWVAYALILGMATSFLIQSVQKPKRSPARMYESFSLLFYFFVEYTHQISQHIFWVIVFW